MLNHSKLRSPVKFPLAQQVRDEYAGFYFQISLRMGSLEILICVINIIITLEIDMGFREDTKTS